MLFIDQDNHTIRGTATAKDIREKGLIKASKDRMVVQYQGVVYIK